MMCNGGFCEKLNRVKLSKRQKRELLTFMRRLREEPEANKVYLFGSRVYGVPLRGSDLVMIVISEKFKEQRFIENMESLSRL